jgi:hypothetical protein
MRIEEKLYHHFICDDFTSESDIEKELTNIIGYKAHCYDTKIDDGVYGDSEDDYVMMSAFEFDDSSMIVRFYYGNNTKEIGCVSVDYK